MITDLSACERKDGYILANINYASGECKKEWIKEPIDSVGIVATKGLVSIVNCPALQKKDIK